MSLIYEKLYQIKDCANSSYPECVLILCSFKYANDVDVGPATGIVTVYAYYMRLGPVIATLLKCLFLLLLQYLLVNRISDRAVSCIEI